MARPDETQSSSAPAAEALGVPQQGPHLSGSDPQATYDRQPTQTIYLAYDLRGKPIGPENKGYMLLMKMGWSEGQRLGPDPAKRTNLLEPLKVTRHPGTTGLGANHRHAKRMRKKIKRTLGQERLLEEAINYFKDSEPEHLAVVKPTNADQDDNAEGDKADTPQIEPAQVRYVPATIGFCCKLCGEFVKTKYMRAEHIALESHQEKFMAAEEQKQKDEDAKKEAEAKEVQIEADEAKEAQEKNADVQESDANKSETEEAPVDADGTEDDRGSSSHN